MATQAFPTNGRFFMTQRRIYQEGYPYFVTFRTREGYQLFEDDRMVELLSEIMFNASQLKRYNILAYQIMPDHVHVLVNNQYYRARASLPALTLSKDRAPTEGCARGYDISQFMHTIKSYFCDQIRDKFQINYPIFQRRFYTRIVDNRRYLRIVIEYMKHNPIKTELPLKYHSRPYQYFDRQKIQVLF